MTDKQINTCEFLSICQTDCNGTLEDTEMCSCYELYKQLKRKEQECERLKYDNDYQIAVLETTIDNLKAELEQEQTLKEMYFTYYKAKHGDIKGKLFRYKQTLTEIKEIILGVRNYLDCPSPKDVRYEMDIILRKISEVEDDRQD